MFWCCSMHAKTRAVMQIEWVEGLHGQLQQRGTADEVEKPNVTHFKVAIWQAWSPSFANMPRSRVMVKDQEAASYNISRAL